MKLKVLTLFVLFAFVTGFSWGKSDKKSESKPKKTSAPSATSAAAPAAVAAPSSAPKPAVASDPNATVAAVRMLTSGTPEERKARMESLQRLGAALRKKRAETPAY